MIDLSNKVNIINFVYAIILDLCTKKIDGFYLNIFEIIILDFVFKNRFKRVLLF